mmetsp:Transcript_98119/g.169052  ORF Transcript_98119/g.169052 Transcript_98119/m.169052 type:complete len:215 (+) Transcript_98119:72-716(+)
MTSGIVGLGSVKAMARALDNAGPSSGRSRSGEHGAVPQGLDQGTVLGKRHQRVGADQATGRHGRHPDARGGRVPHQIQTGQWGIGAWEAAFGGRIAGPVCPFVAPCEALVGQRGANQLELHPFPDVWDHVLQCLIEDLRPLSLEVLVLLAPPIHSLPQTVGLVRCHVCMHRVLAWRGHLLAVDRGDGHDHKVLGRGHPKLPVTNREVVHWQVVR